MSKQRKMLDVKVDDYIDFYDVIDGKTADEVIEAMESFKKEYAGRDMYFDIVSYGYDGGKELTLRERRLENDKEYEKRIAEEKKEREAKKKTKADKQARELAEFMRLKKKFEKV
jgi:hypothetical protein